MSIQLTISGTSFDYPSQGDSPPNGEVQTGFAKAVADALNTLSSSTDILNSSFTIADNQTDNQTSAANIVGLAFDIGTVRSFICEYSIYRSGTTDKSETGILMGSYTGSAWHLSRQSDADVGLVFTITSAGQIQYTSSSSGASGTIKYRARTFTQ